MWHHHASSSAGAPPPDLHDAAERDPLFRLALGRGSRLVFAPLHAAPDHRHAGESSPTYMYHAESRERMVKTLPDVKVVIILRNPTERAYSHYWHSWRKGFDTLSTFEEAINSERRRTATDHIRRRGHFSYVDRGHYIDQLEALEDAIGRSQLHVLLLEDLINDQEAAVTAVLRFLRVRTRYGFGFGRRYATSQGAVVARSSSPELSPLPAARNGTDTCGSEIARAGAYPPIDPSTRSAPHRALPSIQRSLVQLARPRCFALERRDHWWARSGQLPRSPHPRGGLDGRPLTKPGGLHVAVRRGVT